MSNQYISYQFTIS